MMSSTTKKIDMVLVSGFLSVKTQIFSVFKILLGNHKNFISNEKIKNILALLLPFV